MRPVVCSLLVLLPGLSPLAGEITNLRVQATTTTGAILEYVAPDANPCLLEVSTSPSYAPLAGDVNPALFSGSNSDFRPGNVVAGRDRVFAVGGENGLRHAPVSANGNRVSRALQADTLYYYRITCNADQATGEFRTTTIPFGRTYNEYIPTDPASPGAVAWPTVNLADRNWQDIDPQTGVLIKRLSFPNMAGIFLTGPRDATYAKGTAWTNPSAVLANDNAFASITGSNQGICVSFEQNTGYVMEAITAQIDGRVASGATGDDAKIQVALTLDCVNPKSKWLDLTLPTAGSYTGAHLDVGDSVASPVPIMSAWLNPNQQPPRMEDINIRYFKVTTNGTEVSQAFRATFSYEWSNGSWFRICNDASDPCTAGFTEYEIASVENGVKLTLKTSAGVNGTARWAIGPPLGFLIRKKTASAHLVEIDQAKAYFTHADGAEWNGGSGSTQMCAPKLYPDAGGKPGYLCAHSSQASFAYVYWIAPSDGEVRLLGRTSCGTTNMWDVESDPARPVTYCTNASGGIDKATYTGNFSEGSNTWTQTSIVANNAAVMAKVTAFEPDWDLSRFPGINVAGYQDSLLVMVATRGVQNSFGWTCMFDPASGEFVACKPSWKYHPARWCGLHTVLSLYDAQWLNVQSYGFNGGGAGTGPYRTTAASSLPAAPFQNCEALAPGHPFGTLGNWCSPLTLAAEPAGPAEDPDLGPTAVGDFINTLYDGENLRVIAKNGLDLVVERGYSKDRRNQAHASGVPLHMVCSNEFLWYTNYGAETPGTYWWDYRNDPHGQNLTDPHGARTFDSRGLADFAFPDSHPTHRGGVTIKDGPDQTQIGQPSCANQPYNDSYGIRNAPWPRHVFSTDTYCVGANPAFSGVRGVGYGNFLERHISYESGKPTFWDSRPLNHYFDMPTTVTPVTGQLYKAVINGPFALDLKRASLYKRCSSKPLLDVSGPETGNVLSHTEADSYKMCAVYKPNECRTGSVPGEVYVNCPRVSPYTWGSYNGQYKEFAKPNTATGADVFELYDVAVGEFAAHGESWTEYSLSGKPYWEGEHARTITKALHDPWRTNALWNNRTLPDGSWAILRNERLMGVRPENLIVRIPADPPFSSTNRGDFIPVTVSVGSVPPGVDNVVVRFGYNTSFHCQSGGRQEACVAAASTISTGVHPYWFETADAPIAGRSCTSGCSVEIPAISGRMLYYQVVYRDAGNTVMATGPKQVAAVP